MSVALLLLLGCLATTYAVKVDTNYGPIQGQYHKLHTGVTVNSFMGIRFAKPPKGDLRWQPPQPVDKWTEVYKANKLGHSCPQDSPGLIWATHIFYKDYDEDCLFLNIYTPENMEAGPYPVMVFIHGGGWTGSGSIQYPGYFLAAKDVIVVSMNYRLSTLGFLSTKDGQASGNYGLMDQHLALKFVKENIKFFGGNPDKVTIFGQSAGAASTDIHMLSPKAKGMYQQAIIQSGSDTALWAVQTPESNPWNYTIQLSLEHGCPVDNTTAMMACLRTKDAMDLAKFIPYCTDGYFCSGFAPVVDGPGGYIPEDPVVMRERGDFEKVPIMSGYLSEDGSLYAAGLQPDLVDNGMTHDEFLAFLDYISTYFTAEVPERAQEVYEALRFYYTPWPTLNDTDKNRLAISTMFTDLSFGVGVDLQLKQMAPHAPTYSYVFGYRATGGGKVYPEWMGVPHNTELCYLFGWTQMYKNPTLRKEHKASFKIIPWDEKDEEYSDFLQTLWTNFAKYGNPTPKPVKLPLEDATIQWDPFTTDDVTSFYMDRVGVDNRRNYRQQPYAFWREFIPTLLSPREGKTAVEETAEVHLPREN